MKRPAHRTELGISTGDIVTTSYGTGPYEVWDIHNHHESGISLTLVRVGDEVRANYSFYYINGIMMKDGHWVFHGSDELYVEHRSVTGQPALFEVPS